MSAISRWFYDLTHDKAEPSNNEPYLPCKHLDELEQSMCEIFKKVFGDNPPLPF